ncbi:uncharacterized protein G2W53_039709 [Senna tora]|uniref:Uncharacterized protein n=1 Tax=Senna tora TaxID=362788 RepID=A0A834SN58_9FABA|nr:uncharacterized protein G2W53_039709 [Senna tora]
MSPPPLEKPLPRKGKLFAGSDESSASGRATPSMETPTTATWLLRDPSGHHPFKPLQAVMKADEAIGDEGCMVWGSGGDWG